MQTNYKIDLDSLDKIFNKLPEFEKDHLLRCKKISYFLLKKCTNLEWYFDNNINPDIYSLAVYYHDLGKSIIKNNDTKNEKVSDHVIEGQVILNEKFKLKLDKVKVNSFEYLLYKVVSEHHEYINGRGYPYNLKEHEISVIGKVCSLVNYFDNNLIKPGEIKPNFSRAIKKITEKRNIYFDASMVDSLLEDKKTFETFVKDLFGEAKKTKNNLGINLEFLPVYDISNNLLNYFIVDDYIVDNIYGAIFKQSYSKYLQNLDLCEKYDHSLIYKVCNILNRLEQNYRVTNIYPLIVKIYLKDLLNKKFCKYIVSITKKYNINKENLYLAVKIDDLIIYNEEFIKNINYLNENNINLILDSYEIMKYNLDYKSYGFKFIMLSFDSKYEEKNNMLLKGINTSLHNFNIKVILHDINKPLSYEFLKDNLVDFVSGYIYHESVSENDLSKFLSGGDEITM